MNRVAIAAALLLMSLCANAFTVVIDAGHGGRDAGAVGRKSKEKNINLAVALALGKMIEDNCAGVKVVYTRQKDVFVDLDERANIANRAKADLFISIHQQYRQQGGPSRSRDLYPGYASCCRQSGSGQARELRHHPGEQL